MGLSPRSHRPTGVFDAHVPYGTMAVLRPPPLGDTDRSRYVKLTSVEDAQQLELRGWIERSNHVPGWR